ncbi:topoisomerase I damage affected protein 7-like [Strongylocentrotus purpuratus]|uniref:Sushi domain-containing protein n=1 Tax=Strongylocentrotus purpuratus TaxID=7668 RepID=A0A7M7NYT1_STRPU|nr:topoisomerase I damage affected protein 7-like [Strongylocentrotus purpuratus]
MDTELVHAIESIFTMLDGYLLSKIVSFSDPGTSGLDVYADVFIEKSSVVGTLEEVSAETDRILGQSATIDGLSSRFTLDGASVLVSEPCEVPDLLEGIVFESSNEPLENVWYPDSTTFSLSCGEEDYIIDGPTQLICDNGAWVPEGETICIELQTTSTADVKETLRQTTPIAETTRSTQDSIGATSAPTNVTQFHATIEETEARMTRTTKLRNEATSETLTEWIPLTTVYSVETTVNDLLTTVRRPVTYTTGAYSTNYLTDEPFQTDSANTMARSDDPTTSDITETTKDVLKTSSTFTSISRMNSHALSTSQDTQTAEELSTSAFFHPSTVAPTEGGLFSTHETVSAVTDEVTDSDLVTSHSATMPEGRTASIEVTSAGANQETSSIITDLKTDSNKGYSIAIQLTEGSTDVGTTMKAMN